MNQEEEMYYGTCKFFNSEKFYGFLKSEDNTEFFVHGTGIVGEIKENDKVQFQLKEGKKGLQAFNVKSVV